MALARKLIKDPVAELPAGVIEVPSYPGSAYMHIIPAPGVDPKKLSLEARLAIANRPIDPHLPNRYGRHVAVEQAEEKERREAARKAEAAQRIAAMLAKKQATAPAEPVAAEPKKFNLVKKTAPASGDTLRAASVLRIEKLNVQNPDSLMDSTRAHIYKLIKQGGATGTTMSAVRKANAGKPVQASIEKLIELGAVEVISY